MSILWNVLVPLAQTGPNPADVKQGWTGFAVFVFLAAAVVFLSFSFRKQLRKVNFEEGGQDQKKKSESADRSAEQSAERSAERSADGEGPADGSQPA
jgi:hypothetical protein